MNYYVLFHMQDKTELLIKRLSEIEGFTVFYPKYEHYRRDRQEIGIKPTYPGYVFVKTAYDQEEFDELLVSMKDTRGLYKQIRKVGLGALTEEEKRLFEMFYDKDGVLKMSYCTRDDLRLNIISGPLEHMERFIIKYDQHNKVATLEVSILGKRIQAGLWCYN